MLKLVLRIKAFTTKITKDTKGFICYGWFFFVPFVVNAC